MSKTWLLRRVGVLPEPAPVVAAATTSLPAGLDLDGVKAFLDEVRRVLDFEQKRSDAFAQRATAILGFDGVIMSVLVAGLALIRNNVEFTGPMLVNVVAVDALLVLSAIACLIVLHPRKVDIPGAADLRRDWASFIKPATTVLPAAQIANSFLGAEQDPLATANREATSRGEAYKTALYLLFAAVIALGGLVGQALAQQT